MNALLYIAADKLSPVCPKTADVNSYCGLPTPSTGNLKSGDLHTILQIVLGILGSIALLVIVIAGLRYITSAGDPQKAANARSTIIFALIGLVIAISAEAIVTFILAGL